MKLIAPTKKDIRLKAVRVSAPVEAKYRKRLLSLIDEMYHSMIWWIGAAWNKNPPIATQANDAKRVTTTLAEAMERLKKHWEGKFEEESVKISKPFVDSSIKYYDTAFMAALKEAGFVIPFSMTLRMQEAGKASMKDSVSLIKSIQSRFHTDIEGEVWRAVSNGYKLDELYKTLHGKYGLMKKRAKLIARDQASKANAVIEKARRLELGIEEAEWRHSGAGREPRPSHVAMNRKRFKVKDGMYDDNKYVQKHILPGELINCRCFSNSIIPGINR